jgi:type IV pilus assembly protein PilQ
VLRNAVVFLVAALITSGAAAQSPLDGAPPADGRPTVAVTQEGRIELHLTNVPLPTVLELLSLESRRNIVASPDVKGAVTANLFNVTFEEALEAILVPNDASYRKAGNFVYVYTNDELRAMADAAAERPATRVFHLNYISAADAQLYVSPLVGESGAISVSPAPATGLESEAGAGGSKSHALNDFIIVTAPPGVLREVERVLKEIDARPRQVLVEATILRAELTDDNALGIDFTLVGGVDLELLGSTSEAIQEITVGDLPQERFENFNSNASTDFAGNVPDGGLTLGVIKDHVAVFLRALEQVTDTTVIANPKILALNRQKGQVIVGRRDGFLTTTVTETQAVQTVEFLETGTQLIFRPFVGNDGWVRVELHPEDSVGFINAQGLPSEQTTEVTTNVMIRDNETILIGGLFREVTTDTRSQVPGIGSIPYLGQLFRSNEDSTGREEVIILLTIHVVKDQDAYSADSEKIFDDMERMRVGLRQGMMWHGRTQLAQSHYHKAVQAVEACDDDKALWHAKLALHNDPRLLPAMQIRERITCERAWDADTTISREFIHRLIARETGLTLPIFNSPGFRPPQGPWTPPVEPEAQPAESEREPAP